MLLNPNDAVMQLQAASYQPILRQPYQSRQSQRIYHHIHEKEVYQTQNKLSWKVNKNLFQDKTYYINKSYYGL